VQKKEKKRPNSVEEIRTVGLTVWTYI